MSQILPILRPVNGPSPNVGSGLTPPYGVATTTEDGISQGGTGQGLGANGIAGGTLTDQTLTTSPTNRTAYALDSSSPNIDSGLAGSYPTTVVGPSTAAVPTGESV
jgi:hypothetical protein